VQRHLNIDHRRGGREEEGAGGRTRGRRRGIPRSCIGRASRAYRRCIIQGAFAARRTTRCANSRISLLFARLASESRAFSVRSLALHGGHVGSTMRMAAATAKPVPAKNVNGISASPVNLFSSYCCARKKPAATEHAFGSCSIADRRRSLARDPCDRYPRKSRDRDGRTGRDSLRRGS